MANQAGITLYVLYSWLVVGCAGAAACLLLVNWLRHRYAAEDESPPLENGPSTATPPSAADRELPDEANYVYKDGTHGK